MTKKTFKTCLAGLFALTALTSFVDGAPVKLDTLSAENSNQVVLVKATETVQVRQFKLPESPNT